MLGSPEAGLPLASVIRAGSSERRESCGYSEDSREATASLNDYSLKNLGHLAPLVEPLLTRDPSHAGKLRAIGGAVNLAKHDDAIPAAGVLKVALGDLRFLKKTYL